MEMTGEELIPLPQETTWNALNDTAVLKACIPGCDSIEQISPTEFELAMTAKVGPVSAKFKGRMTLSDVTPPQTYTLTFEGQGGVAGFAKGQARVDLAPDAGGTRLTYSAKAMVGGKLAQVGARLIDGVARKMAAQFFTAFNKRMSGEQDAA
jgi:carbon monoxide dehydrogenase subunit G